MNAFEVNFDGIVGPSHNYAGLSFGNVASTVHGQQTSNPKAAALQGLAKMRFVHQLGIRQAVLPPLLRPRLDYLRSIGFGGNDTNVIESAWKQAPHLLAACYSASNMWTANAATASPSMDCADGKLHITPANLNNSFHRAIEATTTTKVLRAVFDENHFVVHDPLASNATLSDEGAANHTRLCPEYGNHGIELFVFGRIALDRSSTALVPTKFPARQTKEAFQAIARNHQLSDDRILFVQQNPQAIDAGVFHNDVVSVGNRNVLLAHEWAFVEQADCLDELKRVYQSSFDDELHCVEFSNQELPIGDAVRSYLFNSQLLSRPDGGMTLLCPMECKETESANRSIERLLSDANPVDQVEFMDLRQSMNNGGGPACLRLRVVLREEQLTGIQSSCLFDDQSYATLTGWVEKHYRESLAPEDLRDPQLAIEIRNAIDELEEILHLPTGVLGANEF